MEEGIVSDTIGIPFKVQYTGHNILDTHEQTAYILVMKAPHTLQEAIVYFGDPERAFEYAKLLRWPAGKVICPRCNSEKNSFIKTRRIWFCYGCQKQFTLKVGTIFEDSAIGLDKWMTATWMLVNCRNGVSSYEIARTLGITQKSAWFMLQRIRAALQEKSFVKLGGPGSEVEVDETFIGGKARNMHKSKRMKIKSEEHWGKAIVMGILERGGKVTTRVISDRKREALRSVVDEVIEPRFRRLHRRAPRVSLRSRQWLHA
jgi:transposase-like protein